ncbi:hypothetical protein [Neomegalonema sp.]|uniref:hypothetical protein n=1 Tax=Neomegalonema sp. TaxID=2039713 RepID=UPI002615D441|nr:hypothetical protein [Neomegalonema sp.]MDD2869305.1 hypothetical protein [Neomegalonema sp.]
MTIFQFSDDTPKDLPLSSSGSAQGRFSGRTTFSITNLTARPQGGRISVRPLGEAKADWFKIVGASPDSAELTRSFAPSDTFRPEVSVAPPADAPPGEYKFQLQIVSTEDPAAGETRGPIVRFTVPEVDRSPGTFLRLAAAGAILALTAFGGGYFLRGVVTSGDVEKARNEGGAQHAAELAGRDEELRIQIGKIAELEEVESGLRGELKSLAETHDARLQDAATETRRLQDEIKDQTARVEEARALQTQFNDVFKGDAPFRERLDQAQADLTQTARLRDENLTLAQARTQCYGALGDLAGGKDVLPRLESFEAEAANLRAASAAMKMDSERLKSESDTHQAATAEAVQHLVEVSSELEAALAFNTELTVIMEQEAEENLAARTRAQEAQAALQLQIDDLGVQLQTAQTRIVDLTQQGEQAAKTYAERIAQKDAETPACP